MRPGLQRAAVAHVYHTTRRMLRSGGFTTNRIVDGQLSEIIGTARAVDDKYNHLKVNFFGNFEADYYIVALDGTAEVRDTEYQWAVVSSFQDRVLWVLTRSPNFSDEQYELVLEDLEDRGFDLSSLKKTPHKQ